MMMTGTYTETEDGYAVLSPNGDSRIPKDNDNSDWAQLQIDVALGNATIAPFTPPIDQGL